MRINTAYGSPVRTGEASGFYAAEERINAAFGSVMLQRCALMQHNSTDCTALYSKFYL